MSRIILALATLVLAFSPVFAGEKGDEATYRKIEAKLESTVLENVAYDEADVKEVIKDFARKGRITIVLDKAALDDVDDDDHRQRCSFRTEQPIEQARVLLCSAQCVATRGSARPV